MQPSEPSMREIEVSERCTLLLTIAARTVLTGAMPLEYVRSSARPDAVRGTRLALRFGRGACHARQAGDLDPQAAALRPGRWTGVRHGVRC